MNKVCGSACQLHHGVHVLALALVMNRLVLYDEEWRYEKRGNDLERTRGDKFEHFDNDNEPNPNAWTRSHGIHNAAPASSGNASLLASRTA